MAGIHSVWLWLRNNHRSVIHCHLVVGRICSIRPLAVGFVAVVVNSRQLQLNPNP